MQQVRAQPIASHRARAPDRALLSALCGMLALASSLGIGRFVYTPILPSMAGALGFDARTAGLIASANFGGYLAGAVVASVPSLPGSRRAWFVGGLLVGAATTLAMGLAHGLTPFLLLRFLGGASSAFVLVLGTAAVLDALAGAGRSSLRWLHYAGVGLGIALSASVISALEAAGAGWRTLWIAAGVIAAAMIPAPAAALRWPAPAQRGAARTRLGRGLVPVTACHFLFGFGYVMTATFLVAMVRAAASGQEVGGSIWLVVGLAAFPSFLLWDRIAARLGARAAYALAALLEAGSVLLAGAWPTRPGLLIAAVLFGGTFMGLTALGFAVAREFGADGQERRFAVITVGFGLGQVIGPVLGGALSDWSGGFWVPSALAAGALALAAAIMGASARGRTQ